MKKSTRIRPAVESLESMLLLSTAAAPAHGLVKAAAHVAPIAPVATATVHAEPTVHAAAATVHAEAVVALRGTLKGTGKIAGTSAVVNGSGKLGAVGQTTFKLAANLLNPPTSVTLNAKKGKLFLQAASPLVGSGNTGSTTYNIVGGTKAYANATGSGSVIGTYSLAKNKVTVTIRFV